MKHLLSITFQHIRRSPYQAAGAVMIMTLTMFVGLSFLLLSLGSQRLLSYLEQKPQVIAFFNDTVTSEDQLADIENQLKQTNETASIKFVSKEQALEIYKNRHKDDPLLLELVTSNILPASLEVSAKSVSDLPALYNILIKAPNIEDVAYQKDIVNSLISALDKIRKFGVGLISFMTITSIFIILTIVGMKIALRKEEIDVERLVGASKWYISLPFLFEGFFYGAVGALISWAGLYSLLLLSTPYLTPFLSGLGILPLPLIFVLAVLVGAIFAGGLVGTLGSMIAVVRYLKE